MGPSDSSDSTRTARRRGDGVPRDAAALAVALLLFAALATLANAFVRFDRAVYDALIGLVSGGRDPPLILNIDEASLAALGRWPWSRQVHADIVERLDAKGVRGIGFDILFADPEPRDPGGDAAFVAALQRSGKVVLPMAIDRLRAGGPLLEVLPAPEFLAAAARIGHAHVEADDDGVVRGVYLWQGIDSPHWPHFALALAGATPAAAEEDTPPSQLNTRADYRLVPFVGPAGAVPQLSIMELLNDKIPDELLRNRVVLVGVSSAVGGDSVATPLTEDGRPMSGVEFNAHVHTAAINGRLISPLESPLLLALGSVWALLPFSYLLVISPRRSLIITASFALLPIALSWSLLQTFQLWYPPVAGVATVLLSYPLWAWRRLEQTLNALRGQINDMRMELERLPIHAEQPSGADESTFIAELTRATLTPDSSAATQPPGWNGDTILTLPIATGPQRLQWQDAPSATTRSVLDDFLDSLHEPPPAAESPELLTRQLARLNQSVRRQRALFDVAHAGLSGMRDGIVLLSRFGQILFANTAARSLIARSLVGGSAVQLTELMNALRPTAGDDWWQALRQAFIERRDTSFPVQSSDEREWLVHLSPELNDAKGVVITLVDITALRRAERSHRETLSFLSHDLRAPITSLLALITRYRQQQRTGTDLQMLDELHGYGRRALDNAEQFVQLTRVEHLGDVPTYELDLFGVAENAVAQVMEQALLKHTTVQLHCDKEEGIWVHGSGEFLERALINLLMNAIKYCPDSSTIVLNVSETEQAATLAVSDNGPGIPPLERKRILDAYYRGEQHRQQRHGVGLGLRFVDVVAKRHNGHVAVEQSDSGGARFVLHIPKTEAGDVGR